MSPRHVLFFCILLGLVSFAIYLDDPTNAIRMDGGNIFNNPDETIRVYLNHCLLQEPYYFLFPSTKPLWHVLTFLLSAPFKALGASYVTATRLLNSFLFVWSIIIVSQISRKLGTREPFLTFGTLLLLTALPFVFLGLTADTSMFHALALFSVYLWLTGRRTASCIIVALLPMVKSEGAVFVCIWGLLLVRERKTKLLPLLCAPTLVYFLAHLAAYGELLNPVLGYYREIRKLAWGRFAFSPLSSLRANMPVLIATDNPFIVLLAVLGFLHGKTGPLRRFLLPVFLLYSAAIVLFSSFTHSGLWHTFLIKSYLFHFAVLVVAASFYLSQKATHDPSKIKMAASFLLLGLLGTWNVVFNVLYLGSGENKVGYDGRTGGAPIHPVKTLERVAKNLSEDKSLENIFLVFDYDIMFPDEECVLSTRRLLLGLPFDLPADDFGEERRAGYYDFKGARVLTGPPPTSCSLVIVPRGSAHFLSRLYESKEPDGGRFRELEVIREEATAIFKLCGSSSPTAPDADAAARRSEDRR